ncbi:hypothetical protein EVG20_g8691 [Dentipellis fragilis]|uniref:Uncharacterized protein n=1 Tax=Dentipellis fragilis TaxID=205917 RepID=A0A4Y9Y544_9AGAM|nr:hypothetical protein EVG20_g8691 [Dentipellis fragilis]
MFTAPPTRRPPAPPPYEYPPDYETIATASNTGQPQAPPVAANFPNPAPGLVVAPTPVGTSSLAPVAAPASAPIAAGTLVTASAPASASAPARVPVPVSASSSAPAMCEVSPSLSDMEVEVFGHRIMLPESMPGTAHLCQPPSTPLPSSDIPTNTPSQVLEASSDYPARMFDTVVMVSKLMPQNKKRGKKCTANSDPDKHGPFQFNTGDGFDGFSQALARRLQTTTSLIDFVSVEWRFIKPNNAAWSPLRDAPGFLYLAKQINFRASARTPKEYDINIRLNPPRRALPTDVPMPWASAPAASSSRGGGASGLGPGTGFDAQVDTILGVRDEQSGDEDDGSPRKKRRFDDELKDIMDQIDQKYAPGICSVHPDVSCFHHCPTNCHYILDRPMKVVWAAQIRKDDCSLLCPPMWSTQFHANKAAPAAVAPAAPAAAPDAPAATAAAPAATAAAPAAAAITPAAAAITPAAAVAPTAATIAPAATSYPGFLGISQFGFAPPMFPIAPYNMFSGFPMPMPLSQYSQHGYPPMPTPSNSHQHSANHMPGSSSMDVDSCSSPPPSGDLTLDEFCQRYKLKDSVKAGLVCLDFEVGDDLRRITSAQWSEAGIGACAQTRILDAYSRYKKDIADNNA